MRWRLSRWLDRFLHWQVSRRYPSQVQIGPSTHLLPRFRINFMANRQDRAYVRIGEGGCVGARLLFESDQGEITIGDGCYISSRVSLVSRNSIRIGNHVALAWGATVYDHDSQSLDPVRRREAYASFNRHFRDRTTYDEIDWSDVRSAPIVIEDDAWIGFEAVILKGVTIGRASIVGARSVVTQDVPPYTVVAGNPARVVKTLTRGESAAPVRPGNAALSPFAPGSPS